MILPPSTRNKGRTQQPAKSCAGQRPWHRLLWDHVGAAALTSLHCSFSEVLFPAASPETGGRAAPLWEGRLFFSFAKCSVGEASTVLISWWQRHKALLPTGHCFPFLMLLHTRQSETKNMCTGLGVQTSHGFLYRGSSCGWKDLCFCPPVPSGQIRASHQGYPVGTCKGMWLTKVFGKNKTTLF